MLHLHDSALYKFTTNIRDLHGDEDDGNPAEWKLMLRDSRGMETNVARSNAFIALFNMLITHDVMSVGERAAVVARSTVRWSVDGCRSAHSTAARDSTSTTAADNRRHRTVVFRQTHCSTEVRGRRRPAGDESDE